MSRNAMKRLFLYIYFLSIISISGCSQHNTLAMGKKDKKPPKHKQLSHAMERFRSVHESDPILAKFLGYVLKNDIKSVETVIKSGAGLHLAPIDDIGSTALSVAVTKGHTEMVKLFLTKEENKLEQACNADGDTLLIMAIRNGHIEVVELLLQQSGINLHQANNHGKKALGEAIAQENRRVAQMLLEKDATIVEDADMINWLMLCCVVKKNKEIASLLLQYIKNKEALLNQKFQGGLTLLQCILGNSSSDVESDAAVELAHLVISHGADINIASDTKGTALMLAAHDGRVKMVQLLLAIDKHNIDHQNDDGISALMMAVENNHPKVAGLLMGEGADPNVESGVQAKTALMVAAGKGYTTLVDMLMANSKTDVKKNNRYGKNALYFAIKFWHPKIIDMLLNATDADWTSQSCPLLLTELFVRYFDRKVGDDDKLLIQKICNKLTDFTTIVHNRQLHTEKNSSRSTQGKMLLEDLIIDMIRHEDILTNGFLLSSLHFYIDQRKIDIEEPLIELDRIKPKGRTLLSYAAEYGNHSLFDLLLAHTPHIDATDRNGRTPLSYAAEHGHYRIFNELVKRHANIHAMDLHQQSIVDYALTGCIKNPITSQCIVQKLLHNAVDTSGLSTEKYLQLIQLVLSQTDKGELLSKLNIYAKLVKTKDTKELLSILNSLKSDVSIQHEIFNKTDREGRTLLSHAAATDAVELVELLAQKDTIDKADESGKTALFYAIEGGHFPMIQALLQKGAHVNHLDKTGCSPLVRAIQSKKYTLEIIKELLKYSPNLHDSNMLGHGALWYAVEHKHKAIIDLLLPNMVADPRCHTDMCAALFWAEKKGLTDVYNNLIELIAPILEQDDMEWTLYTKSPKFRKIVYSTHATNRTQERGITYKEIEEVIHNPNTKKHQSTQSEHILKLFANNLCVVVAMEAKKMIVITTYFNRCAK